MDDEAHRDAHQSALSLSLSLFVFVFVCVFACTTSQVTLCLANTLLFSFSSPLTQVNG